MIHSAPTPPDTRTASQAQADQPFWEKNQHLVWLYVLQTTKALAFRQYECVRNTAAFVFPGSTTNYARFFLFSQQDMTTNKISHFSSVQEQYILASFVLAQFNNPPLYLSRCFQIMDLVQVVLDNSHFQKRFLEAQWVLIPFLIGSCDQIYWEYETIVYRNVNTKSCKAG